MSFIFDPVKDNDWAVRKSYWLLRSIVKKVPKKVLEGSANDYLENQIDDTIKSLAGTIERNWTARVKEFKAREKLPKYGDHMLVVEWIACVENGGFIDYDGHGSLATDTEISDIEIHPSDVSALKLKLPSWATHVMWFNR